MVRIGADVYPRWVMPTGPGAPAGHKLVKTATNWSNAVRPRVRAARSLPASPSLPPVFPGPALPGFDRFVAGLMPPAGQWPNTADFAARCVSPEPAASMARDSIRVRRSHGRAKCVAQIICFGPLPIARPLQRVRADARLACRRARLGALKATML